jgi:hypothetical protein
MTMYEIDKLPALIDIGYVGETKFRTIQIDMSAWEEQIPEGMARIVCIRPGESEEDAYVAETTYVNRILSWNITMNDLGGVEGVGAIQVWLEETTNNTVTRRAKSTVAHTLIHAAIEDPADTSPPARSLLFKLVAEAITLSPDSTATAAIEHDQYYGTYKIKLGIPKGDKGDKGDQGDPAPVATVSEAVTAWMAENITEDPTVVIDKYLAVEGAAADSKAVGQALVDTVNRLPGHADTDADDVDLDVTDEDGNVLVRISDGHIKTKNFNSKSIGIEEMADSASGVDLDITDSFGNVLVRFKGGHIKTSKFDSESIANYDEQIEELDDSIDDILDTIDDIEDDIEDLQNASGGILYRNKEVLDGVYAICRWHQPNLTAKQFCILVSGDIHSDATRLANMVEYFNAVPAFDGAIMLGDVVSNDWTDSATYYTTAISQVNKPWLTVIGNHDAGGFRSTPRQTTQYTYIADLVEKFITPNIQYADLASGEYPSGASYYYKDFTSQKIRIIVLNQYEYPSDYDSDAGDFVYMRGYECYSQAQMTWFCNTLGSTPSDYGVIVAMHSYPSYMTLNKAHILTASTAINRDNSYFMLDHTNGYIIEEIVEAWINGSTLSKTFNYTVSGSYGTGIVISADFTERGPGEFISYLGGHFHMSTVSTTTKYGQPAYNVACSTMRGAIQGDTPRAEGTRSEDNFCALAVDREQKTVKIIQIGAHFTRDAIDRLLGSYSYGGGA